MADWNSTDQVWSLYDVELKSTVAGKDAEISDLKIRIDDLSNGVTRESRAKDELQSHYQHRLREKQAEVEQYRR